MKENDYYFVVYNNIEHYYSLKKTVSHSEEFARKNMAKFHLKKGDVIECLVYEADCRQPDGIFFNLQENNAHADIQFTMYMRRKELAEYLLKDILKDRYYCKYCKKNISDDDVENYIGIEDHSLIEMLKTCKTRSYL